MTSDLDNAPSSGDRARSRAYLREFLGAILAYVAVLPVVIIFGDLDGTGPVRFVWTLLPMLPALGVVWAVWRHLQRIDEYQRMLLLQSLALGFAVMLVVTLTVGFLATAGLPVTPGTVWCIYGAGMAACGIATGVLSRRNHA